MGDTTFNFSQVDVKALTTGTELLGPKPPDALTVVDNGTYARVHTTMCYADKREKRLDDLRKYMAENRDYMSWQQADAMQGEADQIQRSINPNEVGMSAGPTPSQTAHAEQVKEANEHIDAIREDPLWWVAEGLGRNPKEVAVLHKLTTKLGEGMGEVAEPTIKPFPE